MSPGKETEEVRRQTRFFACDRQFVVDLMRAIRVAAWGNNLTLGDTGLRVVQSFPLIPAAPVPKGPIVLNDCFEDLKRAVGVGAQSTADGVEILIIDVDRPDPQYLPAGIVGRLNILSADNSPIRDWHGTMVTHVVGEVARNARLSAIGLRDGDGSVGWRKLHNAISQYYEYDLIVAAVVISDRDMSNSEIADRDLEIEQFFRGLACSPIRPVVLFPTGNGTATDAKSGIAAPARIEDVIAIGAVDNDFRRSSGSRYGPKRGGDASRWWVSPGGSFPGGTLDNTYVSVGGEAQAGTSVAVAFAAGVVSLDLATMRREAAREIDTQDAHVDTVIQRLLDVPADNDGVERRRRAMLLEFGAVVKGARGRVHLIQALERHAQGLGVIPDYSAESAGRGLLTVASERELA